MKHYDNKNDLIRKMREVERNNIITQNRADKAVASSWTAYMMLGMLTLYEDLGFRDKRLNAFNDGIQERLSRFNKGELSLEQISKDLYDKAGVIVEGPK